MSPLACVRDPPSIGPSRNRPICDSSADGNLQPGFYITIAAIPASFAIYKFSRSGGDDKDPYLTRYIRETYDDLATKWARRNDLHTRAMEQAAADRVLFLNESTQNVRTVDLRFPE